MQFRDLKKQYNQYREEIDQEMQRVIDTSIFIGGSIIQHLEEELAAYVGVKHCISCANGTDAMQLSLMNWNIGKGDAVFVPDFTFFSTAEVVALCGATPVMVDIEEDTFNMSPVKLQAEIEKVVKEGQLNPKAIIPVDLFGQPADFANIRRIADYFGLYVLEDGAQGFGGRIGNGRACSFGDIATTSFFPAKPLGCYGDGGAIFTNDDDADTIIRSYKIHGKGYDKYDNVRVGMNSRLDTIQAAVLQVKFNHFNEELQSVNQVAERYYKNLKNIVRCPIIRDEMYSSWAQYTILLEDEQQRIAVQKALQDKEIPSMIYYAKGMHQQEALQEYLMIEHQYPITEDVCKRCLSLPMHPFLEKEEVDIISGVICDTVVK